MYPFFFGLLASPSAGKTAESSNKRSKGAAELDLEYYLKDIFNFNSLDPVMERITAAEPARTLDERIAKGFDSIAWKEIRNFGTEKSAEKISEKINSLALKIEPIFQRKAKFPANDLTNQYTFDMFSYANYKVALEMIKDSKNRSYFLASLGNESFDLLVSLLAIEGERKPIVFDSDKGKNDILSAIDGIEILLSKLEKVGFIEKYKLSGDDFKQDWEDFSTVNFQLEVFNPATLGSFVQANGEGSRFHIDYIGPVIKSYLDKCQIKANYEEYILDSTYRPNPNEFVASEVYYQWFLEK